MSHEVKVTTIFEDASILDYVNHLLIEVKCDHEVGKLAANDLIVDRKQHHLQVEQVSFTLIQIFLFEVQSHAHHLQDLIVDKVLNSVNAVSGKSLDVLQDFIKDHTACLCQLECDLGVDIATENHHLGQQEVE